MRVRGKEAPEVDVPRNWSLLPEGLNANDEFRLMFLTPSGHQPYSTDIEYYNNIVQAHAADGHADVRAYSSWFRVLGSTPDVDARDNTGTTGTGVPIYWLDGNKVAEDYADFYDDTWDDERNPTTRDGTTTPPGRVWSGSEHDGTEALETLDDNTVKSRAFGSQGNRVRVGKLNSGLGGPLDISETMVYTSPVAYYALSNIFKVVANNPATGVPTISGNPREGETLTADPSAIGDPDGAENAEFTYQWVLVAGNNETDIADATESTYVLKDAAGNKIRVKVNFTDDKGNPEAPLASEPTVPIVADDVLVTNTGQTIAPTIGTPVKEAQGFTTGPNGSGYKLDSIGFRFNAIANTATAGSQLTVTLTANNNGSPGNALCTLTDAPTFSSSGVQTFTAPTSGTPCPTLTANTTYFPVIEGSGTNANAITLNTTSSHSENSGGATGWSVNDESHYFDAGTWVSESTNIYMIEVKGVITTETVESDHRTWIENREGEATTTYENTGDFTIAQGFRTGRNAGIYEIHEISVDFDRGQPAPDAIGVRIVESSSLNVVNDEATPTDRWKGGNFPSRRIENDDGTSTFPLSQTQVSGYNILEAGTNYFIIISSTSDDSSTAAIIRMMDNDDETNTDGWSIDDHVYVKHKRDGSSWTKQDNQARIRIAGEYHEGIRLYNDPTIHESCHANLYFESQGIPPEDIDYSPCTVAVISTDPDAPSDGATHESNIIYEKGKLIKWVATHERLEFKVAIWPLLTGSQYLEIDYETGSDTTAQEGHDYIGKKSTIELRADGRVGIISIEVIDDSIEDSGEQVQMHIGTVRRRNGAPAYTVTRNSAYGTIYNSEEPTATASFAVDDLTITESEEATAEFTVHLSEALNTPAWVHYTTQDGTATAGVDYTTTTGTLTFPSGTTTATITVTILNDEAYKDDRNFTLRLTNSVNASIFDDSGEATIKDDEKGPLTAEFGTVPDSHDGVNTFEVFVNFSEGTKTPFLTMQNDVFTITNGTINRAERFTGLRHRWTLTIEPNNGADVTVHLPITTDCDATGAVCTEATPRRPLSNSLTTTVTGAGTDTTTTDESTVPPTVWSADMLVVAYTENSIGAASTDLFTNVGGSGSLEIRSLWSSIPDRDLRLAFTAGVPDADNMTLHVGNLTLEFPTGSSGNGSFKWTEVDADWEDGQAIAVSITTASASTEANSPAPDQDNTQATGLPTISGTPQVGETLTADTSGISDAEGLDNVSYTYEWTAGGSDISGATGSSHLLTSSQQGQTVQVKVTFTDDADNQESLTSAETLAVAARPNTAATGETAISGTPQVGETMTVDTSGIQDSNGLTNVIFEYQWMAADTEIDDATESTYTPSVNDVGKTIKVRVSFTDDAGNDESLTSAATLAVAAIAPTAPLDLTAAPGAQPETLDVAWNAPSSDGGSDITGYTVEWKLTTGSWDTPADVSQTTVTGTGHTITGLTGDVEYTVRVLAANNAGNGPLSTDAAATPAAVPEEPLEPVNNAPTGLPTISGTPQVDQTLTASTSGIGDQDGLENVSYSHQWLADGSTLEGATGATLLLTSRHQGKAISVRVSFSDDAGNAESLTSAATGVVAAKPNSEPTGLPAITGTPQVGETLTADTSSIDDEDGLTNVSYRYQWMAGGSDISGATGSSHLLTTSEQGQTVQVRVTFTDDRNNAETLTSVATVEVTAVPVPLTASFLAAPSSHDGDNSFTFELRFSEEVDLSYVTLRDQNALSVTDGEVTGASRLDRPGNLRWQIVVEPDSGADVTIVLPPTTDCGAQGAICTGGGKKLSGRVELTVNGPEQQNQERQNNLATGAPAISGTPQVEETLTASTAGIADQDGLTGVSYRYQWIAGGSDIDGATGSSHTLTAAEEGQTIQVRVDFTDDAGNDESLTSVATDAVAPKPVPLTASFQSKPSTHDGQTAFTFELGFSEEFGISYLTLRDHAFTVTDGRVTSARRLTQGSNIGWTITVTPDSAAGVTVVLPVTTDCDADGAVCTQGGRKLSNRNEFTVSGPGG